MASIRRRRRKSCESTAKSSDTTPFHRSPQTSVADQEASEWSQGQIHPDPTMSPLTSEQRHLLTYYIDTFVPTFSVVASSRVYHLSLYIPMAFECSGILNAILASAASHLAKRTLDEERADHLRNLTRFHQVICHRYLQKIIHDEANPARNSLETIAVLMLLVAFETQNGSKDSKWQHQLICAGKIVATLGGPKHFIDSGWEFQCVFGHFLYHDSCAMAVDVVQANVNSDVRDTVRMPDWISLCPEGSVATVLQLNIDPLMGVASSLFMTIRQIGRLKQLTPSTSEWNHLFDTLHHEIRDWKVPDQRPAGESMNALGLAAQLDLIALAETYRLGALILLYRTSGLSTTILPRLAKEIMTLVGRVPDGSQVESGLPFPLFMAGGELMAWEDMAACALKLKGVRDRTHIMNIEGIEEVLESVWRSKLNGAHKDWVDILREERKAICVA